MKYILLFLLIFASCQKEYCAECEELQTKVIAKYCGSHQECLEFQQALKLANQNLVWRCQIK